MEVNLMDYAEDYSTMMDFLTDESAIDRVKIAYAAALAKHQSLPRKRRLNACRDAIVPIHPGVRLVLNLSSPNTNYTDCPPELLSDSKRFTALLGNISRRTMKESRANNHERGPEANSRTNGRGPSFLSLARQWLEDNDIIPGAVVLSHFSGFSRGNVYRAIFTLREEGYQIELQDGQYLCHDKPKNKVSEAEVAALEQQIKELTASVEAFLKGVKS
jgi:biotin operon repressor